MSDQKEDCGLSEQLHDGIVRNPKDAGTTPNRQTEPLKLLLQELDYSSSAVPTNREKVKGKNRMKEYLVPEYSGRAKLDIFSAFRAAASVCTQARLLSPGLGGRK